MARRRIFQAGPTVGASSGRSVVSVQSKHIGNNGAERTSYGKFAVTTKSTLTPKDFRGVRPPGQRAFNYPSPSN